MTGVEIRYRLQGNEPSATDKVTLDLDRLELQRVDLNYFKGSRGDRKLEGQGCSLLAVGELLHLEGSMDTCCVQVDLVDGRSLISCEGEAVLGERLS